MAFFFFFLTFLLLSSSWVAVGSLAAQAPEALKVFPSALLSGCVGGEESRAGYLCVPAKIAWVGTFRERAMSMNADP